LFRLWSDFYLSTILVTAIGHRKVGILAARLRFHDNWILSYGGTTNGVVIYWPNVIKMKSEISAAISPFETFPGVILG
jgi:hypothetical protein